MAEIAEVGTPLFFSITVVYMFFGVFFGKSKLFRFALGVLALITAITYAFQVALENNPSAIFNLWLFSIVALSAFIVAAWLSDNE